MRALRLLCLLAIVSAWLASLAFAQAPAITAINVKDTGCYYKVGVSTNPCSIAPGMTIVVVGSNFGKTGGGVTLCDCPAAMILKWSPTRVMAVANGVNTNSVVALETIGGLWTNSVPYSALGPVITSIDVGSCTYIPGQTPTLCLITPGTQITINGSYFGPQTPYSVVSTCAGCGSATIDSWDPNWLTNPSPYNNQITATVNQAACGNTVSIVAGSLGSNFVPYTAC